jgi:hypothetical protein
MSCNASATRIKSNGPSSAIRRPSTCRTVTRGFDPRRCAAKSERDRIWVVADQLCCWPSSCHRVEVNAAAAAQFSHSKRLARQEIGQLRNRSESAGQISRRRRGAPGLLVCKGGRIGIGVTGAVVPPGLNEPLRYKPA